MPDVSTITTKGQVTIPASIRKALGLKPHDKVMFRLDNGSVRMEPAESILLAGYRSAKLKGRVKNAKEIRRETAEWVADQVYKKL